MASTFLRESVSANGNKKKWTISVWVKRSGLGANTIMSAWYADSTSGHMSFGFDSEDRLDLSTWSTNVLTTNRKFRDTNAWYHIQVAVDTDESTADNRARFYVNGVEETSFSTRNNKSSGFEYSVNNSSSTHNIGGNLYSGTTNLFNGSMSHFHFVDGQQYAPTVFGSTDSTTGEWKINTAPTATYGTNGFFILKDGNSVTDQSGQGNNLTVQAGTLTFTHDNPSNIFATINPNAGNPLGLSNGGLKAVQSSGGTSSYNPKYFSNLGYAEGKFYWETKVSTFSTGSGHSVGLFRTNKGHVPSFGGDSTDSGQSIGSNGIFYFFGENTTYFSKYGSNEQSGSLGSTLSSGDIISCSHDVSAGEFKYYVNGSQIGSTLTSVSSANDGYYYIPLWGFESKPSTRYCTMEMNMGNGYFGTTAISTNSGNGYADADSRGKFNYSVPTNHRALCTRGLNQ